MTEQPTQEPISAIPRGAQEVERPVRSNLDDPALYTNRELSWLSFNDRVLQLVEDTSVPLLERVKFAAIHTSNLDEFFMIRVAGVHDQVDAGVATRGRDGRTPNELLDAMRTEVGGQITRVTALVDRSLRPALEEHGIRILAWNETSAEQREELHERFHRQIFPVLTPLAVGLGRPFPYISNLSLSLAVLVRDPVNGHSMFARVKVPKEILPRFVPVKGEGTSSCASRSSSRPTWTRSSRAWRSSTPGVFRVTRDADFEVSDEADDLLRAVEAELRRRRFGEVVAVELDASMPAGLREALTTGARGRAAAGLRDRGDARPEDLWADRQAPRLRRAARLAVDAGHAAAPAAGEDGKGDVLGAMRQGDILVHHPYDSFSTSVERFVEQAVADPDVLAIKMTVYRTSDDSPLVPGAHPRDGARQAGRLPRRAQGPLRRAREHHVGRALEEAACTWSTAIPRSRRTPSACSSCAGRATACATTSTSGRATTTPRPRGCTRTSGCSPATRRSATTSRTSSTS
jgi:polyphosphate kinase